ncbi:MAG: putative aminohydrolase SsnA [Treponemataceae bacterium]
MIIGNGQLITHNAQNDFFNDGSVVVENGLIVDFGKTFDMQTKYPQHEFIDAKGKIIMPALINTHHHIYSAFARGLVMNNPCAKTFTDILKNVWWKIDKNLSLEDTKYSAYATLVESIKCGVGTIFDHHASPFAIDGSLTTLAEAAQTLGIRGSFCYECSDRDGKEIFQHGLQENIDFIKKHNGSNQTMTRGMFGLHASFTLSNQSMTDIASAMSSSGAGYHVHVAEGLEDVQDCLDQYNKRIINRLFDFKMLGEKTLAIHCIHVTEEEMDLLKQTKTCVINNPESNMGNAVGCAPVIRMIEKGLCVGLGSDGYTSDMFESMKVENIIHKHNLGNSNVGFMETGKMQFENNSLIASNHFGLPIGRIEKKASADLILVDYNPSTPVHANNTLGHILFGFSGRSIDSTMIAGKFVMKDRIITTIDEQEVFAKSRETAQKLWNKLT